MSRTKNSGGGLEALARVLEQLGELGETMEVGVFGERRHSRGSRPKLAQLLAWHEFGTTGPDGKPHVPARRPVRRYMAGKGPAEIGARAKAVLPAVLRGEADPLEALKAIGGVAVAGVRKGILERLPPPLAEATKANPRRDPAYIPLYDTKQLYNAIAVRIGGKVHRV